MKKLLLIAASWGLSLSSAIASPVQLSPEEAREIARDAYIYAYPLVIMQVTREVGTNVAKPQFPNAPINQLTHARAFPDHTFTVVVRPNADTLYSAITYNVTDEPLIISLPDSKGRYYLMEFLDYWTDVFTSPGTRTTGNTALDFAIVGPHWQGTLPEGVRKYRSPTNSGLMIGRIQTNGKDDYAAVHAFQDGMRAYPLSAHGKEDYTPPLGQVKEDHDTTAPPVQLDRMDAETFFTMFAELMKDNPPHANDYPILDRIERLGFTPGESFDFAAAPAVVREALQAAPAEALPLIRERFNSSGISTNGWKIHLNAIGTYGTDYLGRAGVAYAGLGANPIEDAIYPSGVVDADGQPFRSDQSYVMHFSKDNLPPVRAFWSLTMYDERQLFAENPIGRYAIGDRDDLQFNEDGSLNIYIQREQPSADKVANWLPTPAEGSFTLMLRMYWPQAEALYGHWTPPAVRRVE